MPYVQRSGGSIVGVFARPQPGRATERVRADSSELLAFNDRLNSLTDAEKAEREIQAQPGLRGLVRSLANRFGIADSVLRDDIKGRA